MPDEGRGSEAAGTPSRWRAAVGDVLQRLGVWSLARLRAPARSASAAWCLAAVVLAAAHAAAFYWVCDDAFISFRYARQLLDGHGLVFNVGERVEGYTNLLWVLEVAVLNLFGVPMPLGSVILSALATAGTSASRCRFLARPVLK